MFEQTFKNIDDVLWKEAGCSSELDYTVYPFLRRRNVSAAMAVLEEAAATRDPLTPLYAQELAAIADLRQPTLQQALAGGFTPEDAGQTTAA